MKIPYFNYSTNDLAVQPRGGRSTIDGQRNLWIELIQSGADILPLTIDSKTRLGMVDDAGILHQQAIRSNTETLNGFPLLSVNFGEVKELMGEFAVPKSLRHGTPIPLRLIKRALDVGISEIEGGPLSYTLPYSRDVALSTALESWESSERECSRFQKMYGIEIVREHFGILTACLVHPLQAILSNILEGIFTLNLDGGKPMASFGSTGCDYQDLATIEAFKRVVYWVNEYFENKQHESYIAFHHWMGPFPKSEKDSISIIEKGTQIAILSKANKVVTKTIQEASGVPSNNANASAVKLVKQLIKNWKTEEYKKRINQTLVDEESEYLFLESTRQLKMILHANNISNIKEIMLDAVLEGYIDPSFSPHKSCLKKTKVLRALDGSLRISSDFKGRCSDNFVKREARFLGKNCYYSNYSADELKIQITHPTIGAESD